MLQAHGLSVPENAMLLAEFGEVIAAMGKKGVVAFYLDTKNGRR